MLEPSLDIEEGERLAVLLQVFRFSVWITFDLFWPCLTVTNRHNVDC
jgi:hypothetical protein